MSQTYTLGDRVMLSAQGKKSFWRTPDRNGTIVRITKNNLVLIHWDGNKPPQSGDSIHASQIELSQRAEP